MIIKLIGILGSLVKTLSKVITVVKTVHMAALAMQKALR